MLQENLEKRLSLIIEQKMVGYVTSKYVTNMLSEDRTKHIYNTDVLVLAEEVKSRTPTLNKQILDLRKKVRMNPYGKNEFIVESKKISLSDSTMKRLTRRDFDSLQMLKQKLKDILEV